LIHEMDEVLKDLNAGQFKRTQVTEGEAAGQMKVIDMKQ